MHYLKKLKWMELTMICYGYCVFPNPMIDEANAVISSSESEKATVKITDIAGKVVFNDVFSTNSKFMLQKSELPSGIYFLITTIKSGETKTIKIINQ